MFPRHNFIKASLSVSVKLKIYSAPFKSLLPKLKIKVLVPAVETAPKPPCLINNIAELSVASRKHRLKKAYILIMVTALDFSS